MQNDLVKKYGLRQGQDEKALWGAAEAAIMVKHQWSEDKLINKEMAAQHSLMYALLCTTGARPGALFKTRDYPLSYLRYSDVQMSVSRENGQFAGLIMKMNLRYLKGYQAPGQAEEAKRRQAKAGVKADKTRKTSKSTKIQAKSNSGRMSKPDKRPEGKKGDKRPEGKKGVKPPPKRSSVWAAINADAIDADVTEPEKDIGIETTNHPAIPYTFRSTTGTAIDVDVTFWFLKLAFLRGQLAENFETWTDVMAHEGTFVWTEPDHPVFQAQKSRSNIRRGEPISDVKVAEHLRNVARDLNLSENGKKGGAYAWRRSALTKFAATFGVEMAKQLAGHTARSNVLVDVYTIDRLSSLDVLSACIPGEQASRYLPQWRPGMLAEPEAGSLLDAAQADVRARTLASLVKATRECMLSNSSGWRKLEIFQEGGGLSCLQDKSTHEVYATLKKILKRVIQDIVRELEHQQQVDKIRRRQMIDFAEASRAYDARPNNATYLALVKATERSRDVQETLADAGQVAAGLEGDDWVLDVSAAREEEAPAAELDRVESAELDRVESNPDANKRIISYGNAISNLVINKDKLCKLCVEDPTIPMSIKAKRWDNRHHAEHMRSRSHTNPKLKLLRWIGLCYSEGYRIDTTDKIVTHLPLWDGRCPFAAADKPCNKRFPTRSSNHDGFIEHVFAKHLDEVPEEYRPNRDSVVEEYMDGYRERRSRFHKAIPYRLERVFRACAAKEDVDVEMFKLTWGNTDWLKGEDVRILRQALRQSQSRNDTLATVRALRHSLPVITQHLFATELRRISRIKSSR